MSLPAYNDSLVDDAPRKYTEVVAHQEVSVKHGFIRKVYAILIIQVLVGVGIAGLIVVDPAANHWASTNFSLLHGFILVVGALMGLWAAVYYGKCYPQNLVFLSVFTVFVACLLGSNSVFFDSTTSFETAFTLQVVFVGLLVYSCQTRHEFSRQARPFVVAIILGQAANLVVCTITEKTWWGILWSILASLFLSVAVVGDTLYILEKYDAESEVAGAVAFYYNFYVFLSG